MKTACWIAATAFALAAPAQAEWVASWTAAPHAPLTTAGPFAAASYDKITLSQMGDFLHGSDAGLKAVADSIDLTLFEAP